jgi:hypothetical protein
MPEVIGRARHLLREKSSPSPVNIQGPAPARRKERHHRQDGNIAGEHDRRFNRSRAPPRPRRSSVTPDQGMPKTGPAPAHDAAQGVVAGRDRSSR